MALTLLRRMSLLFVFFYFFLYLLAVLEAERRQAITKTETLALAFKFNFEFNLDVAAAAFCRRLLFWHCVLRRRTNYVFAGPFHQFFQSFTSTFFLLFLHRRLLMLAPSICHIYFVFIENNRQVSERLNG